MEKVKNNKLIYVIIILSILVGIIIWCALNIMQNQIAPKQEAEKFIGEISEEEPKTQEKEEVQTESTNTTDFFEKKLIYNNTNPVTNIDGYVEKTVKYRQTGYSVKYYVPSSWKGTIDPEGDGARLREGIYKLEDSANKSYEEILEIFRNKIKSENTFPDSVKLSNRTLNINGIDYTLIVMESYSKAIDTYFCLVREGYIYYLEISTSQDSYNENLINTINNIMSTYKIV